MKENLYKEYKATIMEEWMDEEITSDKLEEIISLMPRPKAGTYHIE